MIYKNELNNVNFRYLNEGLGVVIVFGSHYYWIEIEKGKEKTFIQITQYNLLRKILDERWIDNQQQAKLIYNFVVNLEKIKSVN